MAAGAASPATEFEAIEPGLRGEVRLVVGEEHTATHLGSGGVSVLATPQMILLMEQASVAAVDHLLPDGYRTVGVHVNVSHRAPTPVGFEVRASAELVTVSGQRLEFRVQVHEKASEGSIEGKPVGEGLHRRAIVHIGQFGRRIAEKRAGKTTI
jgi:predicted thioesterase